MRASHVTIMCGVRGERTFTMLALEWLLPTMLTNVGTQNGRRREGFNAVRTFIRSFATMYSHMLVKTGRLRKTLPANCAFMRTVLLVDMKHVNA